LFNNDNAREDQSEEIQREYFYRFLLVRRK
jgi:hypothetical protein